LGNVNLFKEKSLIGMVHVRALPGTPASTLNIEEIIKVAVEEAVLLETLGFDAVLLENMFIKRFMFYFI
jgi:predicted TIM-barrel enzyme